MGHLQRAHKILLYRWVNEFLQQRDYNVALDLGCGDMALAENIRANRYIGLDLDAERLARAAKKHPKAEAVCAPIEEIPSDLRGDLVLCLQCIGINHLFASDRCLEVVHKIIAATEVGGSLVFNIGPGCRCNFDEIHEAVYEAFNSPRRISYGRFWQERLPSRARRLANIMHAVPFLARSYSRQMHLYLCESKKGERRKPKAVDPEKALKRELKEKLATHVAARHKNDLAAVMALEPRIIDAFNFISSESQSASRDPVYRAADLIEWLNRLRPSSIHELGTGRSSIVFGVWAAKHGIPYTAFEQAEDWKAIVSEAVQFAGGCGRILHIPMKRIGDSGAIFDYELPDANLLYVDGPSGVDRTYATHDGRCINMDVPLHLSKGHRPQAILIDGRQNTCNHLLTLPEASKYEIFAQYHPRAEYRYESEIRRHTSFLLKSSVP